MASASERREELKAVFHQAQGCVLCPQLAAARTTVVFGSGNADADLMFVGEAPGANEDKQGVPFVGQAGKLLDTLLGEIGLTRGDVFVCNVLKCRPPGNRDPLPQEIDNCQDYLFRQLELIEPKVVCTLGNFATKLLRGDPDRDHAAARARRGAADRPAAGAAVPDLPPGGGALHPGDGEILRADFRRLPSSWRCRRWTSPSRRSREPEPVVTGAGPRTSSRSVRRSNAAADFVGAKRDRRSGSSKPLLRPSPRRARRR